MRRRSLLADSAVRTRLAQARAVLLVLDLDGTLVALRRSPRLVRVSPLVREALRACQRAPGCEVAIVSGRSLRDVRGLVGLAGIAYAGNHGLEMASRRESWIHPAARRAQAAIRQCAAILTRALRPWRGAWVEDKRWTLSVHYRRVNIARRPAVLRAIRQTLRPWTIRRALRVTAGKCVVEVRPPVAWGKGHAVRWLRRHSVNKQHRPLTVIVGDDRTDEEAFRMFRHSAITVFVGAPRQRSNARYRLAAPADVAAFLRAVSKMRSGHG